MTARQTEIRVGLFVFSAILIGAITAFVVGKQRNFFDKFVPYHALFADVEGLRRGSGVRLAGLSVGTVTDVQFTNDGHVKIYFEVAERYIEHIRGNPTAIPDIGDTHSPQPTRASIGSKGMLGDKMLDLSIGDPHLPAWPTDAPLPARGGSDLMTTAARVMSNVEGTARNLETATQPFADQEFSRNLGTVAANLARISTEINEGNGTLARLIRDPAMADQMQASLTNLRSASSEISQTAHSFRVIADEVRSGNGSAHRLIYGPETADAVIHIGSAADEASLALRAIREGDGTMHRLIYENDADQLLANLTHATDDLSHVMADIRAGRGTIGGLVVDPSIYEDVKRLVGDLQRNDILRALVRYSIRRDAPTEDVNVTPGPSAPEPGSTTPTARGSVNTGPSTSAP